MILALAFAASLIPSVALYLWLKKQNKAELEYPGTCRKALIYGFLSALPVLLLGTVAALDVVLIVLFIRFVRRSKTKEKYLTPVLGGQAPPPLPEVENV